MQPVAFAPPLWAVTLRSLRRLTRMAATALALVVGLNGLAAPVTADPLRPVSTFRPLAGVQVTHEPLGVPASLALRNAVAAGRGPSLTAVAGVSRVGPGTVDSPTRHPQVPSGAPAADVPARHVDSAASAVRATTTAAAPPADPGREPVTRRGPPRA
ncbi:hypothetical protein ACL02O_07275 [Micromonospora sp. MS34]|uniref:hypothetical protein n=1 Tax=Micromonospora sp. MS34 TaxID=3385971 RepID=UPI0039A08970